MIAKLKQVFGLCPRRKKVALPSGLQNLEVITAERWWH